MTISGAKNAAVAIIPAAVLAGEACVLENLPHIQDVQSLKEILEELGVTVDYTDGDCMRIDSRTLTNTKALSEAVSSMRASYYLLGALLGRFHEAEVALPGGCVIGARPIDQHLKGMRALGAAIEIEELVALGRGVVHAAVEKVEPRIVERSPRVLHVVGADAQ